MPCVANHHRTHMQTLLQAPGVGKVAKYTPDYNGPSFRELNMSSPVSRHIMTCEQLACLPFVGLDWSPSLAACLYFRSHFCCAGEGLEYTLSFLWKPPILVAWKPRAVSSQSSVSKSAEDVKGCFVVFLTGIQDCRPACHYISCVQPLLTFSCTLVVCRISTGLPWILLVTLSSLRFTRASEVRLVKITYASACQNG
jgi:hypothetical protein